MENSEEKVVVQQKQKRLITIVFVVLILAMPVVYLMYKSSGAAPVENEQAAVPAAVTNISELENLVTKDPSYTNLINLSMAYINNRKPGRSIDHLKKAIELKPTTLVNQFFISIFAPHFQRGRKCENPFFIDTPVINKMSNPVAP